MQIDLKKLVKYVTAANHAIPLLVLLRHPTLAVAIGAISTVAYARVIWTSLVK